MFQYQRRTPAGFIKVTFGRTALCLSGGGGMAFQHFGVIEELLCLDCTRSDAGRWTWLGEKDVQKMGETHGTMLETHENSWQCMILKSLGDQWNTSKMVDRGPRNILAAMTPLNTCAWENIKNG